MRGTAVKLSATDISSWEEYVHIPRGDLGGVPQNPLQSTLVPFILTSYL